MALGPMDSVSSRLADIPGSQVDKSITAHEEQEKKQEEEQEEEPSRTCFKPKLRTYLFHLRLDI
jgi:hypothetical protein